MENKKETPTKDELKFIDADKFINKIKEASGVDEVVLLKDEKNGVLIQLNSSKIIASELLGHATAGYNFILDKRNKQPIPSMIS